MNTRAPASPFNRGQAPITHRDQFAVNCLTIINNSSKTSEAVIRFLLSYQSRWASTLFILLINNVVPRVMDCSSQWQYTLRRSFPLPVLHLSSANEFQLLGVTPTSCAWLQPYSHRKHSTVPRPTATSCPAAPACLPSGARGLSSAEGHAQPLAGCRDVWMGWVFTSPLYYSLWECIKAVNGFNYLLTARHSGIVLTNTKQRRKCSIILHPTLSIQFPASHLWNGSNNTSLSPTLLPHHWQNSCGRAVVPAQHRAHQQDMISAAEQGLTAAQPPPQHKAQLCSTHAPHLMPQSSLGGFSNDPLPHCMFWGNFSNAVFQRKVYFVWLHLTANNQALKRNCQSPFW